MEYEEQQSGGCGDTPVESPISSFELVWDNFADGGYDSICHPDRYITNVCLRDAHSHTNNGSSCFVSLPKRGVSSCGALDFTVSDTHDATVASTQSSALMKDRRKSVFSKNVNVLQTAFFEEEDEFLSDCSTEYFSCNSCSSNFDFSSQNKPVEQQQIECVFSKVKINLNITVTDVDQTIKISCQKWITEQNELNDSMYARASNSSLAVDVGSFSANNSLMEWLKYPPLSCVPCKSVSESVLNTRSNYPDNGDLDSMISQSIVDLHSIKRSESQNIHLTFDDFMLTDEYIEDVYIQYVADTAMLSKAAESEDSIKLDNLIRGDIFEGVKIKDEEFQFSSTLGDEPSQPNVETQDPFGETIDYKGGIDVFAYHCGDQEVHENKMLFKDVFEDLATDCEIEISDSDVNLSENFVAREVPANLEHDIGIQTCKMTHHKNESPFLVYFGKEEPSQIENDKFQINFDTVCKEIASAGFKEDFEFRKTSDEDSVYSTSTEHLLLSDCKQSRIEDNEQIIVCNDVVEETIQPNVETLDPLGQTIDNRRDINVSTHPGGSQEDDVMVHNKVIPKNTFKDLATTYEISIADSDVNLSEMLVAVEATKSQQRGNGIQSCDQESDICVNDNEMLRKDTFDCLAAACEIELGDSDVNLSEIIAAPEASKHQQQVIGIQSCDQEGDIVVNDKKILRKDTFDCLAAACEIDLGETDVNLSEIIAAPEASKHQQQVIGIQSCDQEGDIVVNDNKILRKDTFDCLAAVCEIEFGGSDVNLSEIIAAPEASKRQQQVIGIQSCDQEGDIVVNDNKILRKDTFDCLAEACEIELGESDVSLSEVIASHEESESLEQVIRIQPCEITHQQNEKINPFLVNFDEEEQQKIKIASKRMNYECVSGPYSDAADGKQSINKVHWNEKYNVLGATQEEKKNVLKEKQGLSAAIPDLDKISKTLCKKIIFATRVEIAEERLALEYKRQRAKRQMHPGLTVSTSTAMEKKSKISCKSISSSSSICKFGGQCKCNRCVYRVKQFLVSKVPVKSGTDTTEKEYMYKIQQSKKDSPRVNLKKKGRQTSCHISRCMHDKLFIPKPIPQHKYSEKVRHKVRSQSKNIKPKKTIKKISSLLKNRMKKDSKCTDHNGTQTQDVIGGKLRLLSCSILPPNFMNRVLVEQPAIEPALERNVDNGKTD